MISISVVDRAGKQTVIEGDDGVTLMECLRDGGCDDLLAMCGGCCSCATCHVYVEGGPVALLPPQSEDENELLAGAAQRQENSRLSCQIKLSESLEGLLVRIAPEE